MPEATTYGASVTALQQLDEKALLADGAAHEAIVGLQSMTQSQATLDAALAQFKLDDRTMAASGRLQEATGALERLVSEGAAASRELSHRTKVALESVGEHRQLAQAVQEHGEAAQMEWYRGGR